jgi:hypothetical protein
VEILADIKRLYQSEWSRPERLCAAPYLGQWLAASTATATSASAAAFTEHGIHEPYERLYGQRLNNLDGNSHRISRSNRIPHRQYALLDRSDCAVSVQW